MSLFSKLLLKKSFAESIVRNVTFNHRVLVTRLEKRFTHNAIASDTVADTDVSKNASNRRSFVMDIVKRLRHDTDASLALARRAAQYSSTDYAVALDWLLKESAATGAEVGLRQNNSKEGLLAAYTGDSDESKTQYGCLCEAKVMSDFAARSDRFQKTVLEIAQVITKKNQKQNTNVGKKNFYNFDDEIFVRSLFHVDGDIIVCRDNDVKLICDTASGVLKEPVSIRYALLWRCTADKVFGLYLQASDFGITVGNLGRHAAVIVLKPKQNIAQKNNINIGKAKEVARLIARVIVAYSPTTVGELRGRGFLDIDLGLIGVEILAGENRVGRVLDALCFEVEAFARLTVGQKQTKGDDMIIRPSKDIEAESEAEKKAVAAVAAEQAENEELVRQAKISEEGNDGPLDPEISGRCVDQESNEQSNGDGITVTA